MLDVEVMSGSLCVSVTRFGAKQLVRSVESQRVGKDREIKAEALGLDLEGLDIAPD